MSGVDILYVIFISDDRVTGGAGRTVVSTEAFFAGVRVVTRWDPEELLSSIME